LPKKPSETGSLKIFVMHPAEVTVPFHTADMAVSTADRNAARFDRNVTAALPRKLDVKI